MKTRTRSSYFTRRTRTQLGLCRPTHTLTYLKLHLHTQPIAYLHNLLTNTRHIHKHTFSRIGLHISIDTYSTGMFLHTYTCSYSNIHTHAHALTYTHTVQAERERARRLYLCCHPHFAFRFFKVISHFYNRVSLASLLPPIPSLSVKSFILHLYCVCVLSTVLYL